MKKMLEIIFNFLKTGNRHLYILTSNLLYPAILGAAIVFFFPNFMKVISLPNGWFIIWFSVWFFVAYLSWYVRLISDNNIEVSPVGSKYTIGGFFLDLVDFIAVGVAFYGLGLLSNPYEPGDIRLTFFAVTVVSFSALLDSKFLQGLPFFKFRNFPMVVGFIVGLAAPLLPLLGTETLQSRYSAFLFLLSIFLVCYQLIIFSERSDESGCDDKDSGEEIDAGRKG